MVNVNAELIAPKLEETDKENKILSVMDIILTVMCRGHLECQKKVCKQVIKNIS